MDAVRLQRLLISEVSAVDEPANMLPGWMVVKSAAGSADLAKAYTDFRAASATAGRTFKPRWATRRSRTSSSGPTPSQLDVFEVAEKLGGMLDDVEKRYKPFFVDTSTPGRCLEDAQFFR